MQLVNTQTGAPENLDDEGLLPALAAGTHTPAGAKVLINPEGQLVFSPTANVHANLTQYGYSIPTQEQLSELSNQKQYGEGFGNVAKATLEGVSRGTTFGLSDVLEPHLLGTTAEAIKQRKERNPVASTVGEIGGAVGSALLAPEVAPAGILSRAGEGIAARLAPEALGEGASLAAKALNAADQIGAKAAGSAVEGAAYGLGQTVSEAALGDPDLNAEKIMANIGYGGLFGGALGGLLKAGELAIPASLAKAQETIQGTYDKLVGKANLEGEFEAGPLTKGIAKAGSFATGQPEEEILDHAKKVLSGEGEVLSEKQRRVFYRDFNSALQDHYQAVNKASLDATSIVRPQESAALLQTADAGVAATEHANIQNTLNHTIAEMETHPELYPARFPAKLKQIAEGLDADIAPTSGAADYFKAIQDAKSALDTKIPWNKEISGESADAISLLKDLRSQLKGSLEKEDVWGEAGARTQAYNSAVNDFLSAKKDFQTQFMRKVPTRSGGVTYKINPTKTNSFFNMINDPRGELKGDSLKNFFRASKELVDEIDKTYQSSAFEKFDKETMQSLIEKNEGMATRAQNVIQAQPNRGFGFVTDMFHGAMAATGNPLGIAAMAARAIMDPHTTIARLGNLERAAQQSSATVSTASKAVFKPSTTGLNKAIGPISGKLTEEATRKQYDKRAEQIEDQYTAPTKAIDKLDWVTRDMYHVAPQISSSIQMAAIRGTQFLGSKLPKPLKPPLPFDRPFKPSMPQIIQFNRYYNTVHRPLSALSELKDGVVHPETVETLQAVYPSLYTEMKSEIINSMTSVLAKKQEVPYQQRIAISAFLGSPLDSSMEPQSIQSNQKAMAQQNAEKAQEEAVRTTSKGIGNIGLSGRLKTNIQSTAQRDQA